MKKITAEYITPDVLEFNYQFELTRIMTKHDDEIASISEQTQLAIVVPAYKELFNGNICLLMESLALMSKEQRDPTMLIVVVNRSQSSRATALNEHSIEERDRSTSLPHKYFRRKTDSALKARTFSSGKKENDLTVIFLHVIMSFQRGQISLEDAVAKILTDIGKELPFNLRTKEIKLILKNLPLLNVVDCTSDNKMFVNKDIGGAVREGILLAVGKFAPNVRRIYRVDADTIIPSPLISELLRTDITTEVIAVPMLPLSWLMPEQQDRIPLDRLLASTISYFFETLRSVKRYTGRLTNQSHLGGPQIAISPTVAKTVPYPAGLEINSDFVFSDTIAKMYPKSWHYIDKASAILWLVNRGRPESVDGTMFGNVNTSSITTIRQRWELFRHEDIDSALEMAIASFAESSKFQSLLADAVDIHQRTRKLWKNRAVRILKKLGNKLLSSTNPTDIATFTASLSEREKRIVDLNPLILPMLYYEVGERQITTVDELLNFALDVLPEYFSIDQKPLLTKKDIIEHKDYLKKNKKFMPGYTYADYIPVIMALTTHAHDRENTRRMQYERIGKLLHLQSLRNLQQLIKEAFFP